MRNGDFLKTSLKCVLFSNILNCCAMESNKNSYISKNAEKNVNITEDELQNALEGRQHEYLNNGGHNTIGIIEINDKEYCYSYTKDNSLKKRFDFDYIVKNTLYKFFFNYDQPTIYNRYLQDFVEGECINLQSTILTFYDKDRITKDIKDFSNYIEFFKNISENQTIDFSIIKDTTCNDYYSEKIEELKNDSDKLKEYVKEEITELESILKKEKHFLKIRKLIDKMDKLVFNKDIVRLSLLCTGDDLMRNQIFKYNDNKTDFIQVIPIDLDFHHRTMYISDSIKEYCVNNQKDIEIAIKNVFDNKDLYSLTKLIEKDIRRVYNVDNIKLYDEDYKNLCDLDNKIKEYTKKYIKLVANNLLEGSKYLCKYDENENKFLFNESTRRFLEFKSREFESFTNII